ncbi:hypothetical protein [Rugamonas sp. DEMB1]|uniref:hypothetical protein n=1 Tax=Rugamonas sp. DEMB1 TaxID=3039386 RepID=UPI00244AC1B1|nr:hypothetical protein [Rugamonas sp. DEMB1]WGG50326.1 hypothetical protein QC826_28560 [Rugamonas sp. DEMB1]
MSQFDIESLERFVTYMVLLCFLSGFMGLYAALVVRSVYRWADRNFVFGFAATREFERRAAARRKQEAGVRKVGA